MILVKMTYTNIQKVYFRCSGLIPRVLAPYCHSREGGNLNIDSGYPSADGFRNDTASDTPLLAAGLFILIW